jgi:hypothetical protein
MSAVAYFTMAKQAFQRSNPLSGIVPHLLQFWSLVVNYKSNVRLNQYRKSLYVQQLKRMESFLAEGSPYQYRGKKMDRQF